LPVWYRQLGSWLLVTARLLGLLVLLLVTGRLVLQLFL
jgi:hypothetical protein